MAKPRISLPQIIFTSREDHVMSLRDAISDPNQADMVKDLKLECAELEELLHTLNSLRFVRAEVKTD